VSPRTGRRPGATSSRETILEAARASFAEQGYDATSVRGVARSAGVDPALVHHFFGSKEALFAAAMPLPVDFSAVLPAVLAGPRGRLGERLVRFFLGLWEDDAARMPLLALVRSAVTHEQAAETIRGFLTEAVLRPVAAAVRAPDPGLRATLVGSQLVGLAMVRYVVRVEPIASADVETVVRWVAPTVQRYLTAAGQGAGTPTTVSSTSRSKQVRSPV
jgi:AcrR family transcriptional regulator